MFVYLNKKVSMPGGTRLRSLAWNAQQGWLACGGDNGLLKVLKLPASGTSCENEVKDPFSAAQSNLSMNQTLEGHQGSVLVVQWNENYRKLTSSDDRGLIIVWILHKGLWFEEMVNNRNKSLVKDMKWSVDGKKICIIYEDGQVIVGSVDGDRIWGKNLNVKLSTVDWSPDGRLLLFGTKDGQCNIHDYIGNFLSQLHICFDSKVEIPSIMGIDWFSKAEGYDSRAPTLAIALYNGKIQMMRHELDEEPVLIDTKMNISCIRWSPNGEVLGVVGTEKSEMRGAVENRPSVQLYSHNGIHLRTLQIPGKNISTLAWEGGGLKLALAVDSYIYLANIRPEYKWSFFSGSTCVYSFQKKGSEDYCVIFWDINNGERHSKFIKGLIRICGNEEYCMLTTMGDGAGNYDLNLCNSFGQCVSSKSTTVEPQFLSMNSRFAFVASEISLFCWDYQSCRLSSSKKETLMSRSDSETINDCHTFQLDPHFGLAPSQEKTEKFKDCKDQISCICSSKEFLMVGRDSGILHRFVLPQIMLESTDLLQCRPQAMELNSNSTRLAVIDMNGILKLYDIKNISEKEQMNGEGIKMLNFERKDVWNMKWADDNTDLLAIMEKFRMYILRGTELEEPVPCTAYLCRFHALQIQAVQLDEIMQQPEDPGKEHIFYYETKSQRDTLQILKAAQLQDAFSYIEDHSHPKLWTILAEHALEKLDLSIAEKAFVKCKNYFGIQFVKRIHSLKENNEKKAEVSAYFKRFDEAERLLIKLERADLALQMHMKFGRWFALEKLVASDVEDSVIQLINDNIGKFYLERQNWTEAKKFYEQSKNNACIAYCLYKLGDWKTLEGLCKLLKKEDPVLLCVANYFWNVGMCDQAVCAFIQHGSILASVDCCLDLHAWKLAFELGQKYDHLVLVIEKFNRYIEYLLSCEKHSLAIRAADDVKQHLQAATLLRKFAERIINEKVSLHIRKKVYVAMALKIEKWKLETQKLKVEDDYLMDMLEKPWHHAEAYHYWFLAHNHLYSGNFEYAFRVALWLKEYENVIDPKRIYCLIVVLSFYVKRFQECKNATLVLQRMENISNETMQRLSNLCRVIAKENHTLEFGEGIEYICKDCKSPIQVKDQRCTKCNYKYSICMASGQLIMGEKYVICNVCKHSLSFLLLNHYEYCPLCHGDLHSVKSSKTYMKNDRRNFF